MNDLIRSRIHHDILATYEEPSPDLARRALSLVPARQPRRSPLQVVAVSAALLLIAVAILVARGTHLLSLSQEASQGAGLRPPVAPYSIVDNKFVSATTGWIMIHVTSGPLVLLKTSDGGAHWVEQFRYSGPGSIDSMQFAPNGRDGWMEWSEGGNALNAPGQPLPASSDLVIKSYVTHDGGNHWLLASETVRPNLPKNAPQPTSYPGQTFYLPDGTEGWQELMSTNRQADTVLMHTTDAGATWTRVGTIPKAAADGQLSFSDARTGWLSFNANRSFAWDAQGRPFPYTPPTSLLWVSRDGGASWAPVALPLPAAAKSPDIVTHLDAPVMIDAKHGLLPLQLSPAPAGPNTATSPVAGQAPASFVLKTSDGGDHWDGLTQVSGSPGDGDLLFMSLDHWLTTSGGIVSETTDSGKTWSTRRVLANGLSLGLAQWNYIAPNAIWAQVGAGSLVRSTDGGKTWTAITPPQVH